jgi:hypothetical protein
MHKLRTGQNCTALLGVPFVFTAIISTLWLALQYDDRADRCYP